MSPRVVVVVVTHNSADMLGELLDSLPDALAGVRAQVVIVDNGSVDETVALASARPDCHVITQGNAGYSAGINVGAAAVPDAEAILVLNPDVRLASKAVPALLATMRNNGAGIVAPRLVDEHGRLQRSLRRMPTLGRATGLAFTGRPAVSEYVVDEREYAFEHTVDWAVGAVLLVDRRCHESLGGWDESYFLYSEETDFCARAADLRWLTWFAPDAVAVHIGGGSGRTGRTHAMQIVNRVRFYARRHGPVASALYYVLVLASEVSWLARGNGQSRASIAALVRRRSRPSELNCSRTLVPR